MAAENGQVMMERAVERESEHDVYVTALGVKLQLRPIATYKLEMARRNVPRPQPPILPPRPEDGPNAPALEHAGHPDYLAAMEKYRHTLEDISANIMLYEGTKVLSVPSGMLSPEDDGWIEVVEDNELMLGHAPTVHRDGKFRYIDYLKYYAMADADFMNLVGHLTRWAGHVLEGDVEEAGDSFRGTDRGDTSGRVPPAGRQGRGPAAT